MRTVLSLGNQDDKQKHDILINNIRLSATNMVRCCVSKASFEEHVSAVEYIKEGFYRITGEQLELMLDIPIPKDKDRIIIPEEIELHESDNVYIANSDTTLTEPISYPVIYTNAAIDKHSIGDEIIIGDSQIILEVVDIPGNNLLNCLVHNQYGKIKSGLGIASKKGCITITSSDILEKCIKLIDSLRPETIVLSYIENVSDVIAFRKLVAKTGYYPKIMAKIETYNAVINHKEIISCSDEIMVARGCLAVNVGLENLLLAQDLVIKECKKQKKNVCVASNILKSLSKEFVPNRADIIDLTHMIDVGVDFLVITDSISRSDKCRELLRYINKVALASKYDEFNP